MVQASKIEAQLKKLGVRKTILCAPEIRELRHILLDNEEIIAFCSGHYHGGFAILVATPIRLLLVDKKPLYLTLDDIRYDMIAEVDVSARIFDATITIFTVGQNHSFRSIRQRHLRELARYVQKRVMELRHIEQMQIAQVADVVQGNLTTTSPTNNPAQANSWAVAVSEPQPQLTPQPQLQARLRLPVDLTHRAVGAAAMHASHWHRFPNPYTKGSFMLRTRFGGGVSVSQQEL